MLNLPEALAAFANYKQFILYVFYGSCFLHYLALLRIPHCTVVMLGGNDVVARAEPGCATYFVCTQKRQLSINS